MKFDSFISWLKLAAVLFLVWAGAGSVQAAEKTIVVFGATGKIGGLIVDEAIGRGHTVIGVSRDPDSDPRDGDRYSVVKGDVISVESFRDVTAGADAVIISVHGTGTDSAPENSVHARAAVTAIAALDGIEGAPYVLQIGGATTMYESEEAMKEQLPFEAPEGSRAHSMFFGHLVALNAYRASEIDWTVLTPPFMLRGWTPRGIINAKGTGSYRTSTDGIILNDDGERAPILVADLALAAVDEIENQKFKGQRFTVAN